MAKKKKVYAVRKGRQTGLFDTWEECKRMIQGYSGAVYKSFATREEADAYLHNKTSGSALGTAPAACAKGEEAKDQENQLVAYVDGSYDQKLGKYSFGCILLTPDGREIQECGNGSDPQSLALRNVTGEMLGAMFAVKWAQINGYPAIRIHYDYAGIEQWATHGWQAKNELTQKYAAYMDNCRKHIAVTFTKVAAHTGNYYNEQADKLAKEALRKADGIPPVRKLSEQAGH